MSRVRENDSTSITAPGARSKTPLCDRDPVGVSCLASNERAFGLGDLQTGVKFAVVAADERYLTLQFRGYVPTGEALRGLGTHHPSLEPALLYLEKLSDRLTLESELSYWHPTSGSSAAGVIAPLNAPWTPPPSARFFADVVRYGVSVSYKSNSEWAPTPVFELVGWSVLGGYATISNGGVPSPPESRRKPGGSRS